MNAPKRNASAGILASICLLTALMQLVAGMTILNEPEGRILLSTAGSGMVARILLPLGLAVCLNLAAGVTVYLMRIEALACLGCLLARRLALAVGSPLQLISVLDLLLLFVLLYFAMRLFQPSSARRYTMLLIGLTLGHLSILLTSLPAFLMLVSSGSQRPFVVLAALLGCLSLYVAVPAMRSRPQRAGKLFLFAALAMGLTLPAWSLRYGFSAPFWLGVPIALFGFAQVSAHWRSRL
jgi:hypothetical protein